MPAKQITLAEQFKIHNYETAMFGKWHLGDAKEFLPTRHGFDEWYGIPYSNDMDWTMVTALLIVIYLLLQKMAKSWWGLSRSTP